MIVNFDVANITVVYVVVFHALELWAVLQDKSESTEVILSAHLTVGCEMGVIYTKMCLGLKQDQYRQSTSWMCDRSILGQEQS